MHMSSSSQMSMMMTPTSTATMSTSTAMGEMSMGGDCKISMLWNWYTVDACFLSKTWHITSRGMFAGSCIGVIFLVMALEFLRRLQRTHDKYVRRDIQSRRSRQASGARGASEASEDGRNTRTAKTALLSSGERFDGRKAVWIPGVLPTLTQQLVRAFIHMVQFAVAYFIMLLAMYYNGYILISIIIGAFLGSFFFSWDQVDDGDVAGAADITGCCG